MWKHWFVSVLQYFSSSENPLNQIKHPARGQKPSVMYCVLAVQMLRYLTNKVQQINSLFIFPFNFHFTNWSIIEITIKLIDFDYKYKTFKALFSVLKGVTLWLYSTFFNLQFFNFYTHLWQFLNFFLILRTTKGDIFLVVFLLFLMIIQKWLLFLFSHFKTNCDGRQAQGP